MTMRANESSSSAQGAKRGPHLVSIFVGLCIGSLFAREPWIYLPGAKSSRKMEVVKDHQEEAQRLPFLDFPPSTKEVVLNIGSNRNPILPKKTSGPCAMTVAFEPINPEEIPEHPQVLVVPAAVSTSASIGTMYQYNDNGVSSSLSKAAEESFWNTGSKNLGKKMVWVLSLKDILLSIPPHVKIDFIQTDTQGHDFSIVRSAIQQIRQRGVQYLKTEAYTDNTITYEGVENDLCKHWIPMMTANGYTLVGIVQEHAFQPEKQILEACKRQQNSSSPVAGLKEADALWKISTMKGSYLHHSIFSYPMLTQATAMFTEQDYAICKTTATAA